jgi:hypothetical protein
VTATETLATCNDALTQTMGRDHEGAPRPGWRRSITGGYVFETRDEPKETRRTRYICLPGGTDPRPRGKD